MIEVSDLSYTYRAGKSMVFRNFQAAKGDHWLLVGESGSGKTTLLHLLGGLLKSQKGKIRINGTDLTTLSEPALDRFRGRHLGFVFQQNHLIDSLTVKSNLLMAPFLAGLDQGGSKAVEILAKLGLEERMDSNIKQLSHGEAQRVAIGRALMNQPNVIIADEPTSALDDRNCTHVMDLLLGVANENQITLIIATHDQRLKSRIKNQIQL